MIHAVICTRERPEMLGRLLESCVEIIPDSRSDLAFIVVENGPAEQVQEIVASFSDRLNIQYVHEPKVGIVNARNAGVNAFLKTGGTWMASFDDDEIIGQAWLVAMLDAIASFPFDKAFAGPQHREVPEGANKWLAPTPRPNPTTGTVGWNVSTANALFRREVFAPDGLGLRFHPMFNLSGGSDTHLFFQLKDLGEDVCWVHDAETFEPMLPALAGFDVRLKRNIQASQNWARSRKLRFGVVLGTILTLLYCLTFAINTVTFGVLGAILWVFNPERGFAAVNRSLKMATEAIGHFKAVFATQGEIYAKVHGH